MKKYLNLMVISFLLFISCKTSNSKQLTKEDRMIIQSCIESMSNETYSMKKSYLIKPFFDKFSINEYTKESKIKVFNLLNWNENSFNLAKQEVNSKYNGRIKDLVDFSKGTNSNIVITFSKLHKELVLVKMIYYDKSISIKELKLDEPKAKIHQKDLLLFIFESGEIKHVILDGNSFIREL